MRAGGPHVGLHTGFTVARAIMRWVDGGGNRPPDRQRASSTAIRESIHCDRLAFSFLCIADFSGFVLVFPMAGKESKAGAPSGKPRFNSPCFEREDRNLFAKNDPPTRISRLAGLSQSS